MMFRRKKPARPTRVVVMLQGQRNEVAVGEILEVKVSFTATQNPGEDGEMFITGHTLIGLHVMEVK